MNKDLGIFDSAIGRPQNDHDEEKEMLEAKIRKMEEELVQRTSQIL